MIKNYITLMLASLVGIVSLIVYGCASHDISSRSIKLLDAAESGNIDVVKSLIQEGAPLDLPCPTEFGWTPLIGAIFHNQTNVVKYLVESGANVNRPSVSGETPLMTAAGLGDDGAVLVRYLLEHGADLNATNKLGATVIDFIRAPPPKPELLKIIYGKK